MSNREERAEVKPRPAPLVDDESEPYWSAAKQGRLVVQRCTRCGHDQHYPRPHCLRCRGPVEWTDASGKGTIYSYTVIHQNPSRAFRHLIPFVVALVDLEEGPRLMTNIVGSPASSIRIGAPVKVSFEQISEEAALPVFELTE